MLGICKIYPEYTRDKRMSALDLWSLATKGTQEFGNFKKIRVYRKSVIICKVMNHYAEKSPKNDFQGRGKVRASKRVVRR